MLTTIIRTGLLTLLLALNPTHAEPTFLEKQFATETLVHSDVVNPDEKLIFAFELVRHGARAPIVNRSLANFTVGEGQLTPSGMRQRYLLGRYSRQRYTETFPLIPEEFDPAQVYIQATNKNRTVQSGYSELLGLYPPSDKSPLLSEPQKQALQDGGVAAPPFGVRNSAEINSEVGDTALPNGFAAIDIFMFNNYDINDDVYNQGCPFITDTEKAGLDDDAIFAPYDWMKAADRAPIKATFDLTDEYLDSQNYHHFERLTDTAVCLDYEGWPVHADHFSDEEWEVNHEFQKILLTQRETVDSLSLEMSRIMRKPIREMRGKVSTMLGDMATVDAAEIYTASDLKYMIYSAHDDQVNNMLAWLRVNYFWIPFASQVTFELKYSASCLASDSANEDCFGVTVLSNGEPLMFPGCTGDNFTLAGCKFPEFLNMMDEFWYAGVDADNLNQACLQNE